MQPYRMTPALLRAALKQRGHLVSPRWILECVRKGLLPDLLDRGMGQRNGKIYYWEDSNVIDQAVAIHVLRKLKYPTSSLRLSIWLMGFPCETNEVRVAWPSRIDRLRAANEIKTKAAEKRRENQFSEFEDAASELSLPIAKRIIEHFKLEKAPAIAAAVEMYGFMFGGREFRFDDEALEYLIDMLACAVRFQRPHFSQSELSGMLRFYQSFTWTSVNALASDSTNDELLVARSQWLQLIEILKIAIPAMNDAVHGLLAAHFLSAKFHDVCLSPFLKLIRDGKKREVNVTLENIDRFVRRHEIPLTPETFLTKLSLNEKFTADLTKLLKELSEIWRHQGFPFSPSRSE
jgi:hypothetical protein